MTVEGLLPCLFPGRVMGAAPMLRTKTPAPAEGLSSSFLLQLAMNGFQSLRLHQFRHMGLDDQGIALSLMVAALRAKGSFNRDCEPCVTWSSQEAVQLVYHISSINAFNVTSVL